MLDRDQSLEHHVEVRLKREFIFVEHLHKLFENVRDAQFIQRQIDVLVNQVADIPLQLQPAAGKTAGNRHAQRRVGHQRNLSPQHVVDDPDEILPLLFTDSPHHAEIDEGEAIPFKQKDVPWMRIRMEEAVFEDLGEQ